MPAQAGGTSTADYIGTWTGTWEGGGTGGFVLTLAKADEGKLGGRVSVTGEPTYETTLKTVSFDGKKMTATYDFPPDPKIGIVLTATFEGNSATGTWAARESGGTADVANGNVDGQAEVAQGLRHRDRIASPRMTSDPRFFVLVLFLALLVSLGARAQSAQVTQAPAAGAAPVEPVQPLPYSHKTHVGLGLQCRVCHTNPEAGKLMTYPPTAFCMGCHQSLATDRPSIQKLAGTRSRASRSPGCACIGCPTSLLAARFHLEAEVACTECHGPVAERDVIKLETNVTRMLGCQTCHDKRQAFTDCAACHAPRQ